MPLLYLGVASSEHILNIAFLAYAGAGVAVGSTITYISCMF